MNLTTTQIIALARAKLLEKTTEILTDETLLIYANLTQDDIKKRTFTNDQIITETIVMTNGTGTLPALFGTLYGDAYTTDNKFYPELSIDDFNKKTLSQSVTIEGNTIKVYPTTVASIIIKYFPTYASLTATVNPTLNEYFHELIVYGILHRAFEDLQDVEMSKYYEGKYETDIIKKSGVQSNYEEDNRHSGQMFTEQRLVSDNGSFSTSPNYF